MNGIDILKSLDISLTSSTLIHVHDPVLLPFAVYLSKYFQICKIVYDRHELYEMCVWKIGVVTIPQPERLCEILTKQKIAGVVTILNDYEENVHTLFPSSQVISVPNFPVLSEYDTEHIISKINTLTSNTTLNFIYVGSLGWNADRDIRLILYLADSLMDKKLNVKFIIGGNTSDSELLKELYYRQQQYPNNFIYTDYLPHNQVIKLTEEAHFGFFLIRPETDYWVLASPNKVFEYLRCGVIPILRAKCSYNEDLKKCSLWFERNDNKEKILEKIIALLNDKNKICKMMNDAYAQSEKFSFEKAAMEYMHLYERIT